MMNHDLFCRFRCGFIVIIPRRLGERGVATSRGASRDRAYSIQPAPPCPVPDALCGSAGATTPVCAGGARALVSPRAPPAELSPPVDAPLWPRAPPVLARSAPAFGPLPVVPSGHTSPTIGPSSCPVHFVRSNSFTIPMFYDEVLL